MPLHRTSCSKRMWHITVWSRESHPSCLTFAFLPQTLTVGGELRSRSISFRTESKLCSQPPLALSNEYQSRVSLKAFDAENMVAACLSSSLRKCMCGWHMRAKACPRGERRVPAT